MQMHARKTRQMHWGRLSLILQKLNLSCEILVLFDWHSNTENDTLPEGFLKPKLIKSASAEIFSNPLFPRNLLKLRKASKTGRFEWLLAWTRVNFSHRKKFIWVIVGLGDDMNFLKCSLSQQWLTVLEARRINCKIYVSQDFLNVIDQYLRLSL